MCCHISNRFFYSTTATTQHPLKKLNLIQDTSEEPVLLNRNHGEMLNTAPLQQPAGVIVYHHNPNGSLHQYLRMAQLQEVGLSLQ